MSTDQSQNDHSNISDQQSTHVHQSINTNNTNNVDLNTNVPSTIDSHNNDTHTNTDFHQPASSVGTTGQSKDCTAIASTEMDTDSNETPPFNQTANAAEITRTDSLGQQSTINVQNKQRTDNNADESTSFQGNGFISKAQSSKQEQKKSMTNDNNISSLNTEDIPLSVNDQDHTTSDHQLSSQQDVQSMDMDEKDQSNRSTMYLIDQEDKSANLGKDPIHIDKDSFSNCLHYFLSFKIFSLIITTY
jgi:hypothetical protein